MLYVPTRWHNHIGSETDSRGASLLRPSCSELSKRLEQIARGVCLLVCSRHREQATVLSPIENRWQSAMRTSVTLTWQRVSTQCSPLPERAPGPPAPLLSPIESRPSVLAIKNRRDRSLPARLLSPSRAGRHALSHREQAAKRHAYRGHPDPAPLLSPIESRPPVPAIRDRPSALFHREQASCSSPSRAGHNAYLGQP